MAETFTWGSGGEKLSAADRRRRIAEAMMKAGMDTSPVQHWTQGLNRVAQGLLGGWEARKADEEEKAGQAGVGTDVLALYGGGAPPAGGATAVAPTSAVNLGTPNEVESSFVDGVKSAGLTNPFGLGAVAAYGNAESKFSPGNVNRTWSDPSESGASGTSGGIMSWRADRLQNLQRFAAQRGEQGNGSPATQAAFLAQEDPTLIPRLNAVKSPDEANQIMANAWRFAGYDRQGGEFARRLALTQQYSRRFGQPQVATADMPAPGANPVQADTGAQGFFIPPGEGGDTLPIMQPGGALPNFDPASGRWIGPSAQPQFTEQGAPDGGPVAQARELPLNPVFTAEGPSQPWMGSAIMPAPAAPQMAIATMPPARPADLRADIPAAGATPAIGQVLPALPQPQPDLSNENDAGSRAFASGGAVPAQGGGPSIFERIASALRGGQEQPSAAPSPAVQRVAAAMPAGDAPAAPAEAASPGVNRVATAMRILNSPYATAGQRSLAQAVVTQAITPKERWSEERLPDGSIAQRNSVSGELKVVRPAPEAGAGVQVFRDEKTGEIVAVDKTKVGTGAQVVRPGQPRPDANIDPETKLRTEFSGRTKEFGAVQDAYGRIVASVQNRVTNPNDKSPASDIALVFGYMKMLDPGSVVREGEYATAQNAAGIPERIRNAYNKAVDGEFLDGKQRADMVATAQRLYKQARSAAEAEATRYRDLAKGYGLDPGRVVAMPGMIDMPQIGVAPPAAAGAPVATQPAPAQAPPPVQTPAIAQPKSKADYDALPSGTPYLDPTGRTRTKP